jgi:transcriptional regulator with GAF, ATPase, and Fis domain
MEKLQLPYRCLCPVSEVGGFAHLTDAGITLVPSREDEPAGASLLLLSQVDQTVYDTVRMLSRHGLERVFAVATSAAALNRGAVWRLLQAGAAEVLVWEHTTELAGLIAAKLRHWRMLDELVASPAVRGTLVGESPTWKRVLRQVVEVALTRSTVLIIGESGTGKELVAAVMHALDSRPTNGALHVVDCTTIVPELAGSELFGHERGAFTHAVTTREGAFALANGGTLFLDEVGELPLALQAQLLRVVQEHTFKRVGGNTWYQTDFRLICATNRNLTELVERGLFRADLYHRLASWTIRLPALHERRDDILLLAEHFIGRSRLSDAAPPLNDMVRDYLLTREYPGNVRELKQVTSRMIDRHVGPGPITVADIPEDERPVAAVAVIDWHSDGFERVIRTALSRGIGLKAIRRAAEDVAIEIAVASESGNLSRAARKLGVTGRALQIRRAMLRRTQDNLPD